MSRTTNVIETVGLPDLTGMAHPGRRITLIAVIASRRIFAAPRATRTALPNYALDRSGRVFPLGADMRAGSVLGMGIHAGRRRRLDRIALSVCLEPHPHGPGDAQ
ncbi:MAG: hypothetical protein SNJ69_15935, partial [Chloroflexaceae bacterium]